MNISRLIIKEIIHRKLNFGVGLLSVTLVEFADAGGSVLLVSHDAHAVQYATRTLQLKNGRVRDNHQD